MHNFNSALFTLCLLCVSAAFTISPVSAQNYTEQYDQKCLMQAQATARQREKEPSLQRYVFDSLKKFCDKRPAQELEETINAQVSAMERQLSQQRETELKPFNPRESGGGIFIHSQDN